MSLATTHHREKVPQVHGRKWLPCAECVGDVHIVGGSNLPRPHSLPVNAHEFRGCFRHELPVLIGHRSKLVVDRPEVRLELCQKPAPSATEGCCTAVDNVPRVVSNSCATPAYFAIRLRASAPTYGPTSFMTMRRMLRQPHPPASAPPHVGCRPQHRG